MRWRCGRPTGRIWNPRSARSRARPELLTRTWIVLSSKASRQFGALPLIVLTAEDRIALPGLTPTQADALFRIWNHGHDMIASRSSEGRNQVVPHSSHDIQFYQPGAVIDAIRELVDKARSGTRALPVRD